ncbi:MAG: hypothetical protein QOC81_903 [Thermoanaerobaculia bacterium]|jgi:hypothetical protein|nr:hypothetical protein [Thermoanaerobaculia bacterium]
MISTREIVRPALALFLPPVFVVMIVVPLAEAIIRGHDVLTQFSQLDLPLSLAEPLLLTAGYVIGLSLVRSRLNPSVFRKRWLHLAAGIVSIIVLGVTSVFSQGAHLPWIISACVVAGLVTALMFFGLRTAHRVATANN